MAFCGLFLPICLSNPKKMTFNLKTKSSFPNKIGTHLNFCPFIETNKAYNRLRQSEVLFKR